MQLNVPSSLAAVLERLSVITKNEMQRQDILQQVVLNRRIYSDATKLCFSKTENVI